MADGTGHRCGRIRSRLLICLEPRRSDGEAVPFASILAGNGTDELGALISGAGAYPGRVVIRFAHEPNLDRLPWSLDHPTPCVRDLDEWIDTWRYVARHPPSDGDRGGNVVWMRCVDRADSGALNAESYWPGADHVDVLGIDAYNGFGSWTSPLGLITPMYDRITAPGVARTIADMIRRGRPQ